MLDTLSAFVAVAFLLVHGDSVSSVVKLALMFTSLTLFVDHSSPSDSTGIQLFTQLIATATKTSNNGFLKRSFSRLF